MPQTEKIKNDTTKVPRCNSSSKIPPSSSQITESDGKFYLFVFLILIISQPTLENYNYFLGNKISNNESAVNKKEINIEPKTVTNTPVITIIPPKITADTTNLRLTSDEEIRMERKRKQKEKQEEYRRLMMKDYELKNSVKPNPKF